MAAEEPSGEYHSNDSIGRYGGILSDSATDILNKLESWVQIFKVNNAVDMMKDGLNADDVYSRIQYRNQRAFQESLITPNLDAVLEMTQAQGHHLNTYAKELVQEFFASYFHYFHTSARYLIDRLPDYFDSEHAEKTRAEIREYLLSLATILETTTTCLGEWYTLDPHETLHSLEKKVARSRDEYFMSWENRGEWLEEQMELHDFDAMIQDAVDNEDFVYAIHLRDERNEVWKAIEARREAYMQLQKEVCAPQREGIDEKVGDDTAASTSTAKKVKYLSLMKVESWVEREKTSMRKYAKEHGFSADVDTPIKRRAYRAQNHMYEKADLPHLIEMLVMLRKENVSREEKEVCAEAASVYYSQYFGMARSIMTELKNNGKGGYFLPEEKKKMVEGFMKKLDDILAAVAPLQDVWLMTGEGIEHTKQRLMHLHHVFAHLNHQYPLTWSQKNYLLREYEIQDAVLREDFALALELRKQGKRHALPSLENIMLDKRTRDEIMRRSVHEENLSKNPWIDEANESPSQD